MLDATGGQYEGFNYQGGRASCCWPQPPLRSGFAGGQHLRHAHPAAALLVPLGVLTLLALSPRIYAGHQLVLGLPLQPWRGLFAAIQSSGRAFWPVGYAVMLGSAAVVSAGLPRLGAAAVLATAVALQVADTAPMRPLSHAFLSGENQAAPPFQPLPGATLLRIVPACDPVNAPADLLRLLAIRAGLRLADMRMARMPPGFDCEAALSDGLETPLVVGEIRFLMPSAQPAFRQAAFGAGAQCVRLPAGILCHAPGLPAPTGAPIPAGPLLPTLPAPGTTIAGDSLAPLLATGWRRGAHGAFWSEGPIATLLFRTEAASTITLDTDGIAATKDGTRDISIGVGAAPPTPFRLTDMHATTITLALPVGAPIRVAFALHRPVDPGRRELPSPVNRAAMRLFALRVR